MRRSRAVGVPWVACAAVAVLAGCEASDDGAARAAADSVLTGTVLYRERIALAPDATVEVRLEDVSRADAPADVIAQQTIATDGRQVPIPFELRYSPDRIQANHRYGLRASIRTADGQLMFATTTHQPALEGGATGANVELLVQRAGGAAPAAAGALRSGPWRLVAIRRPGTAEEAVGPEARYTVEFGADARLTGFAHCNRYTGGYQEPEPGRLAISPMAATLMACPEPSIASEFLPAVGGATRYELDGERLKLTYGEGGVLTFEHDAPAAAKPTGPDGASPPERVAAAPEVGRTFVFDCDGDVSFTVRTGPGEMALWAPKALGGKYLVLSMTRSASGARYEEGDAVLWNKGDLATVELAGRRFVDCKSNPRKVPWADAARRGVAFRALGNEPSWYLEVLPNRLAMVTELGARRTELAYAAPSVAGAKTTYRASGDGHELVAIVDRIPCADSMSGEAFEAAATVTFDGAMYYGCGRFLL